MTSPPNGGPRPVRLLWHDVQQMGLTAPELGVEPLETGGQQPSEVFVIRLSPKTLLNKCILKQTLDLQRSLCLQTPDKKQQCASG